MVAFPSVSGEHPDDRVYHANVIAVQETVPWHQPTPELQKLQSPADHIPQAKFFSYLSTLQSHTCRLGKAYTLPLCNPTSSRLSNLQKGFWSAELWFDLGKEGGRERGRSETKPPTWKLQWAECQGAGKGLMTLPLAYCRKMVGLSEQNTACTHFYTDKFFSIGLLLLALSSCKGWCECEFLVRIPHFTCSYIP